MNRNNKNNAVNNEQKRTLVPELRFPEFQNAGAWEEKNLSQMTSYVDYRGKTPIKSSKGIFLLTAKNIKIGYVDYLSSQEYISEKDYDEVMSRGLPKIGDVLITTEAPCGNVAQVDRENVALAQRVIKYRGIEGKLNNTYLKYILLSSKFQDNLRSKVTGGIVKGIKGSVLHKLLIDFPSILEQQKIADCLSSIDELITEQAQKLDSLKSHKKGLMQELFPAEGESLPKFRFSEFRNVGAWEEKKLGTIASIINEKAESKKYTPMSVVCGVGLVSQVEKFGREIAGEQYKNYFVIRENDFAYNKSATKEYPEGFIAMYSDTAPAAVPNSIFVCFRTIPKTIFPKYLNYLFYGNLHGRWLKKYITVGARAHGALSVDNDYLLSMPVPMPELAEQQKIADCLLSIDELITAQAQKLDALKVHKKRAYAAAVP